MYSVRSMEYKPACLLVERDIVRFITTTSTAEYYWQRGKERAKKKSSVGPGWREEIVSKGQKK